MAKLYFRYSAMNSGKSTALLQAAHNYEERGMRVLILKPAIDSKGDTSIVSRLGLTREADILIHAHDSINTVLQGKEMPSCILVDEAQFLTPAQVDELFWLAVHTDTPVLTYGLRTDFSMTAFPGASRLLELAHELQELKTICQCGKKAILNGRKVNGAFVKEGAQVAIDGTESVEYESLCGACYERFVLNGEPS